VRVFILLGVLLDPEGGLSDKVCRENGHGFLQIDGRFTAHLNWCRQKTCLVSLITASIIWRALTLLNRAGKSVVTGAKCAGVLYFCVRLCKKRSRAMSSE
jgi:hypothetical protein